MNEALGVEKFFSIDGKNGKLKNFPETFCFRFFGRTQEASMCAVFPLPNRSNAVRCCKCIESESNRRESESTGA